MFSPTKITREQLNIKPTKITNVNENNNNNIETNIHNISNSNINGVRGVNKGIYISDKSTIFDEINKWEDLY